MLAIAMPRRELGTRAIARTREIERCLAMSPDMIFMMDSDQTMPDKAIQRMERELLMGADIAVVDCPSKDATDSNICYHPDGTLAYASISCCLMWANVFMKISKPWFDSSYAYVELGHRDGKLQWRVDKKYQDDNVGEDIYFIRKCIDAGLTVRQVEGLTCRHYDLKEKQ